MKSKYFFSLVLTLVLVLSFPLAALAQTGGTSQSNNNFGTGGTLSTGTGRVTVPSGTADRGRVDPVGTDDLDDLGGTGNSPPPTGQSFLSEGITLNLWGSTGGPLSSFSNPVKVCFPTPAVPGAAVRYWVAPYVDANGASQGGYWQIMPTFSENGQTCTTTSVPGTFALIG